MKIYKITNLVNQKIYIGQTSLSLKYRFDLHCSAARSLSQKKITILSKAIMKYGKDNFKIELVKNCQSKHDLDNWEKLLILLAKHHQYGCYNIGSGGEGWSKGDKRQKWSLEQRQNLAIKNNWKCNVYFERCVVCNNLFTAKTQYRKYCSNRCRWNCPNANKKLSDSMKLRNKHFPNGNSWEYFILKILQQPNFNNRFADIEIE